MGEGFVALAKRLKKNKRTCERFGASCARLGTTDASRSGLQILGEIEMQTTGDFVAGSQTTEEEQQFAEARLCDSPLHKLLGKLNQPRDGDLRHPFFETFETKPREDEVLAPSQS